MPGTAQPKPIQGASDFPRALTHPDEPSPDPAKFDATRVKELSNAANVFGHAVVSMSQVHAVLVDFLAGRLVDQGAVNAVLWVAVLLG